MGTTSPEGSRQRGESGDGVIKVVVAGSRGTGKTSLIVSCLTESFPDNPPPVLPHTRVPKEIFPDRQPLVLIDTSSRVEDSAQVEEELTKADAVVLTYSCDRAATLDSLVNVWLPLLRRLKVTVPVIVAGCKLDLRAQGDAARRATGRATGVLEAEMAPIMSQFPEVETCLECSALARLQVREVFYYAQRAVVHPTAPLFDTDANCLRPRCVRALKRIFGVCDIDQDGALNDEELNGFQMTCFNVPLQDEELRGVKRLISSRMQEGVTPSGSVTLAGFLFLHALFIERGRLETTWAVLRRFGYSDELELRRDLIQHYNVQRRKPDQSVELSSTALQFLFQQFASVDRDHDGVISQSEIEAIFSTAPYNPISLPPYSTCSFEEGTPPDTRISLSTFIARWSLLALLEPLLALEHLFYLGFPMEQANAALTVMRRRKGDRSAGTSSRRVILCNVFGPPRSGKSTLLDALCGKPFSGAHVATREERYAASLLLEGGEVVGEGGRKAGVPTSAVLNTTQVLGSKVLVLREVPEPRVNAFLDSPDSLASADVSLMVYDCSSAQSWEGAVGILEQMAAKAEAQGNEAPCLLVAAKDDLGSDAKVFPHSARVCAEMGVRASFPVSARLGDTPQLWDQVVQSASKPHLGIPETSATRAQRRRLYRSLTFVGASAVLAVAVVVGYRMLSRRSTSSQ